MRFFPRISLFNFESLIDCFDWTSERQVIKNIKNLYEDVDNVICEEIKER